MEEIILEHRARYPQSELADYLKLIYQNEFGCGHLIADPAKSLQMLERELEGLPSQTKAISEDIGNGWTRLYLGLLQKTPLRIETFQRIFEISARKLQGSTDSYQAKARLLQKYFPASEIEAALSNWLRQGAGPFRHSETYRQAYQPAYRVVESRFAKLLPLLTEIDAKLASPAPVIVAIDGPCGSGKSTLGKLLQDIYGANLISMDDFFLRPQQRTPQRLSQAGGNIDHERFRDQVLTPLQAGQPFSYRPFDCQTQQLGDPIQVTPNKLTIIEGSYSHHPALRDAYDLTAFLTIEPEQQKARIQARNGLKLWQRFETDWIPKEERYFQEFQIRERADIEVDGD